MKIPDKYFNLHAKTFRAGTLRRHRLAGARIGSVGVRLEEYLPKGWTATIYAGRFSGNFSLAPSKGSSEITDWLNLVVRTKQWTEDIKQGQTDFDEGRYYSMDNDGRSPSVPSATWKPDDPSQPQGWHHNGTKWVMNEGWEKDPMGFWHYKPRERARA